MSGLISAGIENIQAFQAQNLRQIQALQPSGELGKAVRRVGIATHRTVVSVTHVDTGALRAAQRIDYEEAGNEAIATIYIDADAVNPKGQRPMEYGVYENRRGGEHAFYDIGAAFAESAIASEVHDLGVAIVGA